MPNTLISVRGEARLLVPPDAAELQAVVRATDASQQTALGVAGAALRALTAQLAGLGAVARDVESDRAPLTWAAESIQTAPEWHPTEGDRSGRTVASVFLAVTVRDFALLDAVGGLFARSDATRMHYVGWSVDTDNAAWPTVRAAAVAAAIAKGRDYAAALGGRLVGIEELADGGLLGGGDNAAGSVLFARASPGGAGDAEAPPSLDPVPQELVATVEARFRAAVAELT